jgi:hypothetical protein
VNSVAPSSTDQVSTSPLLGRDLDVWARMGNDDHIKNCKGRGEEVYRVSPLARFSKLLPVNLIAVVIRDSDGANHVAIGPSLYSI